MKKYVITKNGLKSLSKIFVSCRPLMGEIITPNQLYLINEAKKDKNVYFSDFVKSLPVADPTYAQILRFSKKAGGQSIDEETVWQFFGGNPHFRKIIKQIKELKLKDDFAKRIFFSHILIVAKIIKTKGGIDGVYKNGDIIVRVKNLVSALGSAKISRNQEVLIHYASIVSNKVNSKVKSELLKVQAEKKEFVDACRYVKEIDYDNFWNLRKWSEKIIRERNL